MEKPRQPEDFKPVTGESATDLDVAEFWAYHLDNPCGAEVAPGDFRNLRESYLIQAREIIKVLTDPNAKDLLAQKIKENEVVAQLEKIDNKIKGRGVDDMGIAERYAEILDDPSKFGFSLAEIIKYQDSLLARAQNALNGLEDKKARELLRQKIEEYKNRIKNEKI